MCHGVWTSGWCSSIEVQTTPRCAPPQHRPGHTSGNSMAPNLTKWTTLPVPVFGNKKEPKPYPSVKWLLSDFPLLYLVQSPSAAQPAEPISVRTRPTRERRHCRLHTRRGFHRWLGESWSSLPGTHHGSITHPRILSADLLLLLRSLRAPGSLRGPLYSLPT